MHSELRARATTLLSERVDAPFAKQVESALWQAWGATDEYPSRVRCIAYNLGNKDRNARWVQSVRSGAIPLAVAVRQRGEQIFPELYDDAHEAIQQRRSTAREEPAAEDAAPSDHWEACRKCHSTNTTYRLFQTRRADEGATEYWHCRDCGRRWRG